MEYTGKYIVSLEVPPGIGKTYFSIRVALKEALKGRVVIFALPNHQALTTALAYAVKHYTEMMKQTPARRLPYLLYYEGVNRFCPYFGSDGDKIFKKMLDKMLKEKKLDQVLYDRIKDLSVSDVASIYGSMFICKFLCPIYKQQVYFTKEKVFVPASVSNQAFISRIYSSEAEKSRVVSMLANLTQLKASGLVAEIEPKMDDTGKASGYCLRAILNKSLTKTKVQLVMRGALILTPIHALDFIAQLVLNRIKVLQKHGVPVPRILIIIDEYDFYIYKPVDLPLFLLDQLREEKEIAKNIFYEERNKLVNGDPSYDWERLTSAVIAYEILSQLESEAEDFLETYEKGGSPELLESPANIFADCASKPLEVEGRVYPPFSPRVIKLTKLKSLLVEIYDKLEGFNDNFVNNNGVSLYDMTAVRSLGVKYFLTLWENILLLQYRSGNRKYMYPALYRDLGGVYRIGYIEYDNPVSIARRVMDVASRTDTLALFYKITVTNHPVYKNGKKVSAGGGLLLYGVYDFKLAKIFRSSDYDVMLTSATGVPWLANIFSTRSGGEGSEVPYYSLQYAGSSEISTVFKDVRFFSGTKKEFSYIVLESEQFSKSMLIVTLDPGSLETYASHAFIYPARELPLMPDTMLKRTNLTQYMIELSKAVDPYVLLSLNFMGSVLKNAPGELGVPSFLVLTQRKDIAVMYTFMLASRLLQHGSTKVTRCKGVVCSDIDDPSLNNLMKIEEGASHFVVHAEVGKRKFRFYITWLRSKMSRGIDLPDDAVAYGVMMVGTPYRPPEAFDILPREIMRQESRSRATYIEYAMFIDGYDPRNLVLFVHNPIDVAEAVNEFIQAVGRALRRAWNISVSKGYIVYRIAIIVPWFTANKIFTYSPFWFQLAFSHGLA